MWNEERYQQTKKKCSDEINSGKKEPHDYMHTYKKMIECEDYESAKAITEVLEPLNYFTKDTHKHIKALQ